MKNNWILAIVALTLAAAVGGCAAPTAKPEAETVEPVAEAPAEPTIPAYEDYEPKPIEDFGPNFQCPSVPRGHIDNVVCRDEVLTALHNKLGAVYRQALRKARLGGTDEDLKTEQRQWQTGRQECMNQEDTQRCAYRAYADRIAELQERFSLES